ncbi:MAG: cupin domain-containing protein [Actinomycetota bacterium]|nr:cupin domain-containing protein [Actinomycetota bacterium]
MRAAHEGDALWFLGTLMVIKLPGSRTGGALAVVEATCPPRFSPPLHLHRDEDEAFYLLEGELAGRCGEDAWTARPGDLVFLPRGLPHIFTVLGSQPARVLTIVAPARFDQLVAELGTPAPSYVLPPQADIPDPQLLLETHERLGYQLFSPPTAAPA